MNNSKKPKIFIVGTFYDKLVEYLVKEYNFVGLITDAKPSEHIKSIASEIIIVNFSSKKNLFKDLSKYKHLEIDGLITTYENFVLPKAWLAQFFKLPGPTTTNALKLTDKYLMRKSFQKLYPEITPDFQLVTKEQDLHDFMISHEFPLMLKPTNLVKSLLITKNETKDRLIENYKEIKKVIIGIYKKYNIVNRKPQIIVEEFLDGSMHTIAGFVDLNGKVTLMDHAADITTAQNIGIDDNYLFARTIPSSLNPDELKRIKEVAIKGIRSLNLKNTSVHIEIMLTKDGPKIIEIGGRIGGYRETMYKIANNIDLYEYEVDITLGKELEYKSQKHSLACTMVEIFPPKEGLFKSLPFEKKLKSLKTMNKIIISSKIGSKIGPSYKGYKAPIIIYLVNKDLKLVKKDLNYIKQNIDMIVEVENFK